MCGVGLRGLGLQGERSTERRGRETTCAVPGQSAGHCPVMSRRWLFYLSIPRDRLNGVDNPQVEVKGLKGHSRGVTLQSEMVLGRSVVMCGLGSGTDCTTQEAKVKVTGRGHC